VVYLSARFHYYFVHYVWLNSILINWSLKIAGLLPVTSFRQGTYCWDNREIFEQLTVTFKPVPMDVTGKVSNMEEKKQNVATLAKLDNPFDEHDCSKQTLSKPDVEMGASW